MVNVKQHHGLQCIDSQYLRDLYLRFKFTDSVMTSMNQLFIVQMSVNTVPENLCFLWMGCIDRLCAITFQRREAADIQNTTGLPVDQTLSVKHAQNLSCYAFFLCRNTVSCCCILIDIYLDNHPQESNNTKKCATVGCILEQHLLNTVTAFTTM